MKRNLICVLFFLMVFAAVPAHGFLDYLFSGGNEGGETIGNSVVGDIRAWWSGNPAYQFNPYYRGSPMPQQGNVQTPTEQYVPGQPSAPGGYGAVPPPAMTYYPPQAAPNPYGQGYYPPAPQQQPMAQPMTQQPVMQPVQQPIMQPQQPAQPMYGGVPPGQTYQGAPAGPQGGYQVPYYPQQGQ